MASCFMSTGATLVPTRARSWKKPVLPLEAAAAAVDKAVGRMHAGVSYLVFPEGSRSVDGRLRAFKKGSFVMAIEGGAAGLLTKPIDFPGLRE